MSNRDIEDLSDWICETFDIDRSKMNECVRDYFS